jgi:hypothetical protein
MPPNRLLATRTEQKLNEPPFRPRRAFLTAESAAARLHVRRTSCSHDVTLIGNVSSDSPAAMRRRAVNATDLETRHMMAHGEWSV